MRPLRFSINVTLMEPFARTIDAAKKYVVSSTLNQVDWNAELVRGDLGQAVQELKPESGSGPFVGGGTPAGPRNVPDPCHATKPLPYPRQVSSVK
jgi:hypothetical protein